MCNTTGEQSQSESGRAKIELESIIKDGELVVHFTDVEDERYWTVKCEAKHLQTFSAFQRLVADRNGLWIDHFSQHLRTANQQRRDWQDAVGMAFEWGASDAEDAEAAE